MKCIVVARNAEENEIEWFEFKNESTADEFIEEAKDKFLGFKFQTFLGGAKIEIRDFLIEEVKSWKRKGFNLPQWHLEHLKLVNIKDFNKYESLKALLEQKYFSVKIPDKNKCFENAYDACYLCSGVNYVEGYVVSENIPIPIAHAWNEYLGTHFDLTFQQNFQEKNTSYGQIAILNHMQLIKCGELLNLKGGYFHDRDYVLAILELKLLITITHIFFEKTLNSYYKSTLMSDH